MNCFGRLALVGLATTGIVLNVYSAAPNRQLAGNSYQLYTKALKVDNSGVAKVPSEFQWSVETSWSGIDARGNDLPDHRILLRLYNPHQNFTAMTAQMDMATAAKLHKELGEILVKKMQNPSFQHRPQLYEAKEIPVKRIVGVDQNGVAIVEDVSVEPVPSK